MSEPEGSMSGKVFGFLFVVLVAILLLWSLRGAPDAVRTRIRLVFAGVLTLICALVAVAGSSVMRRTPAKSVAPQTSAVDSKANSALAQIDVDELRRQFNTSVSPTVLIRLLRAHCISHTGSSLLG